MSERSYFICEFRLRKKGHFVIWFYNERDGLLLDHSGKLLAFNAISSVNEYAKENGISIIPEPVPVYDFDAISAWCLKPSVDNIDCELFLNAWNMFLDVSATIGEQSIFADAEKDLNEIYDKLFFGNNLPAITPEGMSYEPEWNSAEVDEIAKVFRAGLQDLHGSLPT